MSLNKEKAVQEYLEYLYGDVLDDRVYAPEVYQTSKDFEAGYSKAIEEVLTYLFNTGNHLDSSEDYCISPKYLTQTIKYLKQQKLED